MKDMVYLGVHDNGDMQWSDSERIEGHNGWTWHYVTKEFAMAVILAKRAPLPNTIDPKLHREAVEEVVRLREELKDAGRRYAELYENFVQRGEEILSVHREHVEPLRKAYRSKTLELAMLRERIGAALDPEAYDRAQREGNYS